MPSSDTNKAASPRTRLTVDLSARHTAFLASYSAREGITKAEALRRAVALQAMADQAEADGLTVGAFGSNLKREFAR